MKKAPSEKYFCQKIILSVELYFEICGFFNKSNFGQREKQLHPEVTVWYVLRLSWFVLKKKRFSSN